jgi:hypothetical protein
MNRIEMNKRLIAGVDKLLEEAGFRPDCSIRHQLSMVGFSDLIEIPESGGGAALRSPDNHLANVILSMLVDEGHCRPEAWPVLIEPIAAIIRKHAPQTERRGQSRHEVHHRADEFGEQWTIQDLSGAIIAIAYKADVVPVIVAALDGKHAPEPQRAEEPKPPEPAREWDAWLDPNGNIQAGTSTDEDWFIYNGWRKITVREVRPEPASVATPLPEGVPALEGEFADFEYSGTKRLVGVPSCGSPDIILFDDIEGWMKNYCGEWWDGSDDISHKAIRRGTELHRLNFGGPEAAGNAASEGAGAFRFFRSRKNTACQWRVASDGKVEYNMLHQPEQWNPHCEPADFFIGDNPHHGIYECDTAGKPLEGGGA